MSPPRPMTPTQLGAPTTSRLQNGCLSALSPAALALLRPHLVEVTMIEGAVVWEQGSPLHEAFFPVSALISIVIPFVTGEGIEVASIGSEAAICPQFVPGPHGAPTRGCVYVGGRCLRIPAVQLLAAADRSREIARLLETCRDWMLTQSQQIAACNAVHSAEQRLCRWLLQSHQRLAGTGLHATQESIGSALGIRRTTVTLLAQNLQAKGLIQYRRGKITISDPARIEEMACECYGVLGRQHWPAIRLREPHNA